MALTSGAPSVPAWPRALGGTVTTTLTRRAAFALGVALAVAAACTMGRGAAYGQAPGAPSADSLRVEWSRRADPWARPAIEGYVHNPSRYRIGSIRLTVEQLDESERPVGTRTVWVYGNIPAGDRGYFSFPILASETQRTYRITVESFVLISLEAP